MADGRAAAWRKRDERHRDRGAGPMSRRNRILLVIGRADRHRRAGVPRLPARRPRDSTECVYPVCFINGNLELPAPHAICPARPRVAARPRRVRREHLVDAVHDVGRRGHRDRAAVVPEPRQEVDPRRPPERRRVGLRDRSRTSAMSLGGPQGPSRTSRCSPRSSCSSCSATGAASSRASGKVPWFRARRPVGRQRHDRPGARRVRLLPVPGLQAPRPRATSASSSRSGSSGTGSGPGSSPCSWGWWSSCWSS